MNFRFLQIHSYISQILSISSAPTNKKYQMMSHCHGDFNGTQGCKRRCTGDRVDLIDYHTPKYAIKPTFFIHFKVIHKDLEVRCLKKENAKLACDPQWDQLMKSGRKFRNTQRSKGG